MYIFNLQRSDLPLSVHLPREVITVRSLVYFILLQEKLPFLPDYKSPCWKELDEVLGPEVKINCLPYFYVVGISQCGTKDLFERLTQHPLISGNMKAGNRWFTRLRFGE
jgi:hypothetical protein